MTNDNNASIEIRNLYKIFGKNPKAYVELVQKGMTKTELGRDHKHILGLNDINISIPAGKIQVVMGLSGSGKSTLIRHINRLIEPTAGSIIINGRNVLDMNETELRDFRRQHTAMVFQREVDFQKPCSKIASRSMACTARNIVLMTSIAMIR